MYTTAVSTNLCERNESFIEKTQTGVKQSFDTHYTNVLVFRVTPASTAQLWQKINHRVLQSNSICLHSPPPPLLPWCSLQFLFTCWRTKEGGRLCVWRGGRKWNSVLSHGPQQAAAGLISWLSCVSVSLSRMSSPGSSEQTDLFFSLSRVAFSEGDSILTRR